MRRTIASNESQQPGDACWKAIVARQIRAMTAVAAVAFVFLHTGAC
jgi:hypothetical protein